MASANTLATFLPYQNEPPAANYATLDTRNGQPVLDFDGSTSETTIFSCIAPSNYAAGGFTCILHIAFTSATTGNAVFACSVERGSTDMDADSFAAASQGTVAANGTSGIETQLTVAIATMDSIVAGDHFRLKVDRLPADVSDDIATDAELRSIEVRET